MAGKTALVEPVGVIVSDTRCQNIALPSARRGLKALKLCHDTVECLRPCHPLVGGHVLPRKEEAQEVARSDGLNLGPQPLQRIMVDTGEQSALTPFIDLCVRRKPPAHCKAFRFKCGEWSCDLVPGQRKWVGKRILDYRPQALKPSTHDLDESFIARPLSLNVCRGATKGRRRPQIW